MLTGVIEWSLANRAIVIAMFVLMALGGLYAATQIPVDAVPAHRVSPAILTLGSSGEVGVKTVDDSDKVKFIPVEILREPYVFRTPAGPAAALTGNIQYHGRLSVQKGLDRLARAARQASTCSTAITSGT